VQQARNAATPIRLCGAKRGHLPRDYPRRGNVEVSPGLSPDGSVLCNDPNAGSPTITLLRLLLPLGRAVIWTSVEDYDPRRALNSNLRTRNRKTQSVAATGGVYNIHSEPVNHPRHNPPPIPPASRRGGRKARHAWTLTRPPAFRHSVSLWPGPSYPGRIGYILSSQTSPATHHRIVCELHPCRADARFRTWLRVTHFAPPREGTVILTLLPPGD
jgi:hypothetical protein